MKKVMKKIGKILLWALAAIVVILLALPLWIGPLVRGVANSIVPEKTGTAFNLGEFGLNPYTGVLSVGDLQLANYDEFKGDSTNAFELGSLKVDVAMSEILGKKKRIESIELDGLLIHCSASGRNFKLIAEHAAGGDEGGKKPAEEPKAEAPKAEEPKAEGGDKAGEEDGGFVVDVITLKNVRFKYANTPAIPVPTITLRDIGKDEPEGATMAEIVENCYAAILQGASAVGGFIGDLGTGALDLGKKGSTVVIDGVGTYGGKAIDSAKELGGKAADSAKELGGKAVDSAKDLGGKAVDGASDAIKGAGSAIKGLFN